MAQPTGNFWLRFGPILASLRLRLEAVSWTPTGGVPEAAFQAVDVFDLADLEKALRELLVVRDRAALIIHRGNQYMSEVNGTSLTVGVAREFSILVTDRDIGDRTASLLGSDFTPGAELLADLVAEQLVGTLPVLRADAATAARGRGWVEIMESTPFTIDDKVRDILVGRTAVVVRIVVHCGDALADLGKGHI